MPTKETHRALESDAKKLTARTGDTQTVEVVVAVECSFCDGSGFTYFCFDKSCTNSGDGCEICAHYCECFDAKHVH